MKKKEEKGNRKEKRGGFPIGTAEAIDRIKKHKQLRRRRSARSHPKGEEKGPGHHLAIRGNVRGGKERPREKGGKGA